MVPNDKQLRKEIFEIVKRHLEGKDGEGQLTIRMIKSGLAAKFRCEEEDLKEMKHSIKSHSQDAFNEIDAVNSQSQANSISFPLKASKLNYSSNSASTQSETDESPNESSSKSTSKSKTQIQSDPETISDSEEEPPKKKVKPSISARKDGKGKAKKEPKTIPIDSEEESEFQDSPSPQKGGVRVGKGMESKTEDCDHVFFGSQDEKAGQGSVDKAAEHTEGMRNNDGEEFEEQVKDEPTLTQFKRNLSQAAKEDEDEMFDDPGYGKIGKGKGKGPRKSKSKSVEDGAGDGDGDGDTSKENQKEEGSSKGPGISKVKKAEKSKLKEEGKSKGGKKPPNTNLTRLKAIVLACGFRKPWKILFKDFPENENKQIQMVKEILVNEIGMKGNASMEKAKKIKEEIEFKRELEEIGVAVGGDENDFGRASRSAGGNGKRRRDSLGKGKGKFGGEEDSDEEEEEEVKKRKPSALRQSLAAFAAQLNSDSDSD